VTDAGSYCWAAKFTATSPTGLPGSDSKTGECFSVTAPTSIATNPWFRPQDRAVISASSGGNLAGSVDFKLFDSLANCTANGATGLLYQESPVTVSGASPANGRYEQLQLQGDQQHGQQPVLAGDLHVNQQ
jgi:hypothetical protein